MRLSLRLINKYFKIIQKVLHKFQMEFSVFNWKFLILQIMNFKFDIINEMKRMNHLKILNYIVFLLKIAWIHGKQNSAFRLHLFNIKKVLWKPSKISIKERRIILIETIPFRYRNRISFSYSSKTKGSSFSRKECVFQARSNVLLLMNYTCES